jgi:Spy/CpxP family protein refolding chaperone
MKRMILWVLLAASLGFNAFFVFGLVQARGATRKSKTAEGRAVLLADRLALNKDQQAAYRRIRGAAASEAEHLYARHGADAANGAFWAEIAKSEPDLELVRDLHQQTLAYRNEIEFLRIRAMVEFQRHLTPDQRRKFLQIVRERKTLFARNGGI